MFKNIFTHKNYIKISLSYGLVRKAFHVQDAKIETYYYDENNNIKKTYNQLLLIDKVLITLVSGCLTYCLAPIYLYNDLKKLEIYNRNMDPRKYGYDGEESLTSIMLK